MLRSESRNYLSSCCTRRGTRFAWSLRFALLFIIHCVNCQSFNSFNAWVWVIIVNLLIRTCSKFLSLRPVSHTYKHTYFFAFIAVYREFCFHCGFAMFSASFTFIWSPLSANLWSICAKVCFKFIATLKLQLKIIN